MKATILFSLFLALFVTTAKAADYDLVNRILRPTDVLLDKYGAINLSNAADWTISKQGFYQVFKSSNSASPDDAFSSFVVDKGAQSLKSATTVDYFFGDKEYSFQHLTGLGTNPHALFCDKGLGTIDGCYVVNQSLCRKIAGKQPATAQTFRTMWKKMSRCMMEITQITSMLDARHPVDPTYMPDKVLIESAAKSLATIQGVKPEAMGIEMIGSEKIKMHPISVTMRILGSCTQMAKSGYLKKKAPQWIEPAPSPSEVAPVAITPTVQPTKSEEGTATVTEQASPEENNIVQ